MSNRSFDYYRPLRWCSSSGWTSMVGLGKNEDTHRYHILLWSGFEVQVSPGYASREVANVIFKERCDKIFEKRKQELEEKMKAGLAGEVDLLEAADAALEHTRLDRADDEASDAVKERVKEFRQTHSDEEMSAWVRDTYTSQLRQDAQENENEF
jgi:hypothetical protein